MVAAPPVFVDSVLHRASKAIVRVYFRVYHRFEVHGLEHLPPRGPLLVLTNHVSLLDVPAFGLADPFVGSRFVAKASLFRLPVIAQVLRSWGAIPVERDGEDASALRQVIAGLREGRVVAAAAEGTRNRQGGLGEVNPVLARLAVTTEAPLVPVVAVGTYRALPPGAWLPRPTPVRVVIGTLFDLRHLRHLPKAEGTEAARLEIRRRLVALLDQAEASQGRASRCGRPGPGLYFR